MENTKEFIVEEAFKLFLNHSYEAVSINDISKAIGLTKGALYHHFRNKEELFKSVVDKFLYIPEVTADLESVSFAEYCRLSVEQAEKVIKKMFDSTLVFTPISYISLFGDAFRHYPGYIESKGSFTTKEIDKVRIVLENAIRRGEIREDINPLLIATTFFSINMGLAGDLIRNNSLDDAIAQLKEQTAEFYKLLKKS